jgi:indolepyruvate ferredoxin oxidoreductase beta subunit
MNNKICNIVFGGIGGQGILTASEICATAALLDGHHVKKSEVHGMAQRGGSVESHVRFGPKVYSPLVIPSQADFLVCFHNDEIDRLKPFLKPGGTNLAGYLENAKKTIPNTRFLNVYLIGVLSKYLDISEDSWITAMKKIFREKYMDQNLHVFRQGRSAQEK